MEFITTTVGDQRITSNTWEWWLTTGLRLGNTWRTSVANVRQYHVPLSE